MAGRGRPTILTDELLTMIGVAYAATGSSKKTAKIVGVSATTVLKALRDAGLQCSPVGFRRVHSSDVKQAASRMYEAGLSPSVIATELGIVSERAALGVVSRNGTLLRRPGRPRNVCRKIGQSNA